MATAQINRWLREKAKIFLIAICVLIMISWLILPGLMSDAKRQKSDLGTVFGQPVTRLEVVSAIKLLRLDPRMRMGMNEQFLEPIAYQNVVLAKEAQRYGIQISEQQVSDYLKMAYGVGDSVSYEQLLRNFQGQPQELETAIQIQLKILNMVSMIRDSVILPDEEAWAMYARDNEKVQVSFIQIDSEKLTPLVNPSEDALEQFHRDHAEIDPQFSPDGVGYLASERVKVEYVVMPYAKFKDQVDVTPEEIAKYYEEHKSTYLIRDDATPAPPTTGDTTEQAIDDAAVSENEGAAEDNQENATAEDAQEPTADEQSEPAAPAYKPLEDVSKDIKATLARQKMVKMAEAKMKSINDQISKRLQVPFGSQQVKTIDLEPVAKEFGLTYKATDFFSQSESIKELQDAIMISFGIFGQGVGAVKKPKGPVPVTDGLAIYQIVDSKQPEASPYEDVKDRVLNDYRLEAAMSMATEIASQAQKANSLDEAESIVKEEIAKRIQAENKTTLNPELVYSRGESGFLTRFSDRNTGLPDNLSHPIFVATAFALKEGEIGMAQAETGQKSVYLLQPVAWQTATRADFEKNKSRLSTQYLEQKREAVTNDWISDIRRRASPDEKAMEYLGQLPQWAP